LLLGRGAVYFFILQCVVLIFFFLGVIGSLTNLASFWHKDGGGWPSVSMALISGIGIVGMVIVLLSMLFLVLASWWLKRRKGKTVARDKFSSND